MMKIHILVLLLAGSPIFGFTQQLPTIHYFSPKVMNLIGSINELKDTIIGKNQFSFSRDTSNKDILYADLKNKQGELIYSGIYKNELVLVQVKNSKGEIIEKTRYKLTEVKPVYKQIIPIQNPDNTYDTLEGYSKMYVKDGDHVTYKHGREISRIYYFEGKILKLRQ